MKIYKAGAAPAASLEADGELRLINEFAKSELSVEEIYTFSVVLCDNEVDRDFERFSEDCLATLAELFVGKTGIFDHEWKSANQTARIYHTELVWDEMRKTALGEDYCCLKGFAYMLRNEKNASLIAEIEAGIKKETSVGCSVGRRCCSICGEEHRPGGCGHIPGREYDGKLCFLELSEAVDAYEWSFVAVPAQKGAGIVKRFGFGDSLKDFVGCDEGRAFAAEYEALEKDAVFGREFRDGLRHEVLRLCLLCDEKLYVALQDSTRLMSTKELGALKESFSARVNKLFPLRTQLPGRGEVTGFDGEVYMV